MRRPCPSSTPTYGPLLNAIQDMWDEHNERVQGFCACPACVASNALFEALCDIGEQRR